ncbi:MAG TPA: LacI family DNA-binding transcriptional regulator [Thermoanaerobaculia bacterium]
MRRASSRFATAHDDVTIRDVAARAGVSVATVSRVFNHKGPVREATYQRVLAVAGRMRYTPHAAARSLSTRSTSAIGVVLPELHGEFFSEVIRGIDLFARERGLHLIVSGSHSDGAAMKAVLQAVRGRVDGLIVMSPDLDASTLLHDLPRGVPVVLLNATADGRSSITIDNAGGARAVVEHLVALGHRRIAFICGPANNGDASQRRRGYRAGLRAAGLDADAALEAPGSFTEESGYEAGKRIVEMSNRPTAVFAANDAMAIGALSAFNEAGVHVPADLALVGFDDIPIARFLSPPLTTVKVPIADLGRRGLALLLDSSKVHSETLKPNLIVRQSCGAGLTRTRTKPQEET